MVYWVFPADDLGALMDEGAIIVQHAMSDTKWFFPSRRDDDAFRDWRLDYSRFKNWLQSL